MNAIKMNLIFLVSFALLVSYSTVYSAHGLTTIPYEVSLTVEPTYKFERADHVANGIMLRNRSSGTILLRGVPKEAEVIRGLLYFNFINRRDDAQTIEILFDGNLTKADHIATSQEPCWASGMVASHSFVSDVTEYILCKAHPNQDYSVVLPFTRGTNTLGENPWEADIANNEEKLLEGATLVIIYQTEKTQGPLFIYDRLNASMFSRRGYFRLFHGPMDPRSAFFTMIGADGQRGKGHNNIVSNEQSFFNGTQIAGRASPPTSTTSVDWDGSDGWPLIQLWDTHTHIVRVANEFADVRYRPAINNDYLDCVVPVAFIIDVK